MSYRNPGDLLVAHTTIELPTGDEVAASWFFTPGSGPELEHVEVDGMIEGGNRDCEHKLRAVIGDAAFEVALEHAMEVAESYGPDPDERRDRWVDQMIERQYEVSHEDDWRQER